MASQGGVRVRHRNGCASSDGRRCNCKPAYEAWVWNGAEGRKVRRTFSGDGAASAAKGWLTDVGKAVKDGRVAAPSRLTVKEAGQAYISKARAGETRTRAGGRYKPSVIREHDRLLAKHVYPAIGHLRLAQLRRRDVQALVDRLVAAGEGSSTVRNTVMPLRIMCRLAIEADELVVNPTVNLRLPAPSGRRERAASAVEAAALIDALPVEDRALWATAFYAGLRRGEIRGLKWSDIDDGVTVIHVQRGWDDVEGEIDPKSRKGSRKVPVVAALRLILLEHKARTGRRDDELVFGRTGELPFTSTHVRKRALRAWKEHPELVPITLHELRHSFVSMMHDAGFKLERIGDYVGHTSTYMTDRYRHLLEGHEKETVDILDGYLAARVGASSGARLAAVPGNPASLSQKTAG